MDCGHAAFVCRLFIIISVCSHENIDCRFRRPIQGTYFRIWFIFTAATYRLIHIRCTSRFINVDWTERELVWFWWRGIRNGKDLQESHLPWLQHMKAKGSAILGHIQKSSPSGILPFTLGLVRYEYSHWFESLQSKVDGMGSMPIWGNRSWQKSSHTSLMKFNTSFVNWSDGLDGRG